MKKVKINVTAADIKAGIKVSKPGNGSPILNCAVARAMKRKTKTAWEVGFTTATFGQFGTNEQQSLILPAAVEKKIRTIMRGRTVKPFSFTISI